MPAPPQTKPSTPRLSESTRHVVIPKGAVSTGWPAVHKKCAEFGVTFRPWQDGAGRIILAKRADGTYASTIGGTGMSIPRQVGKTFLVGAIIFALCILIPHLTVIWTAHRLRTAEETFGKMQVFAKRRLIKPHILKVILGSGEEEILFRNGSRILFGARERGFGRGFDEVDVLVFDEAQLLSENALDDMIPATNQSRQPTGALLLFLGTPPKPSDPGDVFRRMRTEALTGEDDDTGWIEFGADPGFQPTPQPAPLTAADWEQVAKANPSFPHDTPRAAILRMRKKLGPESFLREGLGIWDADGLGVPIPLGAWNALRSDELRAGEPWFGIEVESGLRSAAIAAAGEMADGRPRVALVEQAAGIEWVVPRCVELGIAHVAMDVDGAAAALVQPLEQAGIWVVPMRTPDAVEACGQLQADVFAGRLAHPGDEPLDRAVEAARQRDLGDAGGWVFGRKKSEQDISALQAVTWALWLLRNREDVTIWRRR